MKGAHGISTLVQATLQLPPLLCSRLPCVAWKQNELCPVPFFPWALGLEDGLRSKVLASTA